MMALQRRFGVILFTMVLVLAASSLAHFPAWGLPESCPKCGAPLEPGAAFCSQCGARVEGTPSPAPVEGPGPSSSLVQVIAIHDREMTSVLEAMRYGSTVRVDSLLGSGFAVAPGEIVTDTSLLLGAREIKVRDAKGLSVTAKVVGMDPLVGVGLLSVNLPELTPLPRRTGALPQEGEALTALGFPSAQGMSPSVTTSPGVVSGLHREGLGIHPVEDYIQTDASLPRGFAGGPGLDSQGHLLGMSTAFPFGRTLILGPMVGIGLFIPTDWLERSVAWIRAGQPARPWLGAHVVAADTDSRKLFGIPPEVRWIVEDVFPGGPAQVSGMKRGDAILRIRGESFASLAAVQVRLLAAPLGEKWPVEIYRAGKPLPLEVTLRERPASPRLAGPDALRFYGGVEISTGASSGLVVSRILPGTEASAAKLHAGDVLSSLFTKKDMEHVEKSDAKWRGVKDLEGLEEQMQRAYGDLDFFLGLKFRCADGDKRELFLYSPLTATNSL